MFLPTDRFVGWELDDAVPAARCAELVAMLTARGFGPTGARYPGDYRNNDRLVLDEPALAASLFEALRARLPGDLVIDGERWLLDGLNTRFRACRYGGGQAFCIHRDGPYAPETDRRSHLTLQLYLDDDPARAGGHTRFYADPRGDALWASIVPRVGTAIVFDHRAWHDGEAVTRGIKHVLRTDVMYRRVEAMAAVSTRTHANDRTAPSGGDTLTGPAPAGGPATPDADPAMDAAGHSTAAARAGTVARDGAGRSTAAARAGTAARVLHRHRGYAWHAIVCRDGTIASAGRDGTVHLHRDAEIGNACQSGADAQPERETRPNGVGDASPGAHGRRAALDATIDLGAGSVTRLVEAADGRLWAGTRAGVLFIIDGLHVSVASAASDQHRATRGAVLDLASRMGGADEAGSGALRAIPDVGSRMGGADEAGSGALRAIPDVGSRMGGADEAGSTALRAIPDVGSRMGGADEAGSTALRAIPDVGSRMGGADEAGSTALSAIRDVGSRMGGADEAGSTALVAIPDLGSREGGVHEAGSGPLGAILDLAARSGGGVIAATADGELVAFERNGSIAWRVRAHDGWAWSIVVDGGGGYVSCGHAGQVVAIDERGGVRELARLSAPLRACAVNDSTIWVGDTRGVLHRLDRDGRVLESRGIHRGAITSIALLPGALVATGGEDGCVIVTCNGECVSSISARDFVTSVAHDRHDRTGQLVWASYDGTISVAPVAIGCRSAADDVVVGVAAR